VVDHDSMAPIFEEAGIDRTMASCHTTEVGPYTVVGHMPVEVIEQLLEERPIIRGVTLPGACHPGHLRTSNSLDRSGITLQYLIDREQKKPFCLGLDNQYPVERILVHIRQVRYSSRMLRRNSEFPVAVLDEAAT